MNVLAIPIKPFYYVLTNVKIEIRIMYDFFGKAKDKYSIKINIIMILLNHVPFTVKIVIRST
jgi:hypothetical protein